MPEVVPMYTAAMVRAAEGPRLASGEPLIARAAAALTDILRSALPAPRDGVRTRVLVLAGRGDNGGDALFAASELTDRAEVEVHLTAGVAHREGLAAALAAGARVVDLERVRQAAYDLAVDGIVGIGAASHAGLRDGARDAVGGLLPAVRAGRTIVIAVDVPSGLQPDDGSTADDLVLPASITVTFGGVKAGLAAAPSLTGRIVFVDLGLPLVPAAAVGVTSVEVYRA